MDVPAASGFMLSLHLQSFAAEYTVVGITVMNTLYKKDRW